MALVFLIAISLSMDAFSLALVYGTFGIDRKNKFIFSIIVGMYHFVMPLLGMFIGELILSLFKFDTDILVSFILCFIGIQMLISSFKNEENIKGLSFGDFFLFGLAVSIDSFSLGITLPNLNAGTIISPLIFALVSFVFTFIGLSIGNKIEKLLGKIATTIGGVILTIIGLCFAF